MKLTNLSIKIINLESRPDRWEEVKREMDKVGITNYEKFRAIPGGDRGSVASHLECIKNGTGNLLLFEDDVYFEDNANEIIWKGIEQLPDDFDLFYIGANVKQPAERYSENLFRITGGTHTNHAILFSDHAREVIRGYNPETDPITFIFDHWLFMKGQSIMKCFVCSPIVAFQRSGYSDVRLQFFDYRQEMLDNQTNNMK